MQDGELIGAEPAQHVSLPADDRNHGAGHVFRQRGIFSNRFHSFFFFAVV